MRTRTEFARGGRYSWERSYSRNIAMVEVLFGIDHMEVNLDCVVAEVIIALRKCADGESGRKLALLRVDIFGGDVGTAPTAIVRGRASKGDSNEREEEGESDGKVKNHVGWKGWMKAI